MLPLADVLDWLMQLAPLQLSEDWDNTGLLLGDRSGSVQRIMTCLTVTAAVADEAVEQQADLVVAHHPLPFRPIKRITTESQTGELLWRLASHGVSLYSPHTAWDSAERGINQQLAAQLNLRSVRPLVPHASDTKVSASQSEAALGAGRYGELAEPLDLDAIVHLLSQRISGCRMRGVRARGPSASSTSGLLRRIAFACGSGGSLLDSAIKADCQLFITGEATYHTCLEAESAGVHLLMIGHFASERFAMEVMAERMRQHFSGLTVWASRKESDPVQNF